MRATVGLAVAAGCALAACSLAPHYQRPATEAPAAAYKELDGWKLAAPAKFFTPRAGWQVYTDLY